MDEFSLIDTLFKESAPLREDVIFGIGDDAACLSVSSDHQLLVSTDTLVADVHFLSDWDAYEIAYRAVMVNVSDIAAMAAKPCWASLALTLPTLDQKWLQRFSQGLYEALQSFNIALIGGDTTRGPLSITLTIHGLVPTGKAVRRCGASPGDTIYVSGELGAAALAITFLKRNDILASDKQSLMKKLLHPWPRVDLSDVLQACASAAIDISDGLSADLNHICLASGVGARLSLVSIPVHSLVRKYQAVDAVNFALTKGDDYELCFTVPKEKEKKLLAYLAEKNLTCYPIGVIEECPGLRMRMDDDSIEHLTPCGYRHF